MLGIFPIQFVHQTLLFRTGIPLDLELLPTKNDGGRKQRIHRVVNVTPLLTTCGPCMYHLDQRQWLEHSILLIFPVQHQRMSKTCCSKGLNPNPNDCLLLHHQSMLYSCVPMLFQIQRHEHCWERSVWVQQSFLLCCFCQDPIAMFGLHDWVQLMMV